MSSPTATNSTTMTTSSTNVRKNEEIKLSVHASSAENDHGNDLRSSCGESEILRNRLLFPSGGTSRPNSPPDTLSLTAYCNNTIKKSFHAIMASTGNGESSGKDASTNGSSNRSLTMGDVASSTYPKCNISVSMSSSGNNEHLTVKTTSVEGSDNLERFAREPVIVQAVVQPKQEEVEIKPDISSIPLSMPTSKLSTSSVPLPPKKAAVAAAAAAASVKVKPTVVKIPYDRERIINFLTDYWKSKNLQQVTEAQRQTAGVSGVNTADFCPAPRRIVEEALFDLFVEYPMMIDGLPVTKRAWAKAFYEKDIIQTSKVLFEALFSETEMQQCTLNGKKGTPELSAVKMLAILRAAAWMKNKKQDPYSFNTAIPSHNQFPTNEEREKIEKKVFTERRSQANRKITKTGGNGENGNNSANEPSSDPPTTTELPTASSSNTLSTPTGENRLSLSETVIRDHSPLAKIPKLNLDSEVVKQLQMLYSENPEGLISYLLPDTRSILIDGFLIPHEEWMKAFDEIDYVKSAWTLFKVLFSKTEILNCTLNGKNGTKELCPVKKLAILRAVTWMKENQGQSIDIYAFNVRRSECNCFPSDEDKDKIETKVYTEKRYQACRKLKGQQV